LHNSLDSEESLSAEQQPSALSAASASAPKDSLPSSPEMNTSGRLLWDFLQQLLNDKVCLKNAVLQDKPS
jgi:hypothetical protein